MKRCSSISSQRAKSLLCVPVFIHVEIIANYYGKNVARSLALKEIDGNWELVYSVSLVSVWASFRGNILEAGNADAGFHVSNAQGSLFYVSSFSNPVFILFVSHKN